HLHLHSFPTRRSSDLSLQGRRKRAKLVIDSTEGVKSIAKICPARFLNWPRSSRVFRLLPDNHGQVIGIDHKGVAPKWPGEERGEIGEHTSELQSLAYL